MSIFIQISSSAVRLEESSTIVKILHGLDAAGEVWEYNFEEEKWERLPGKENQ